MIVSFNIISYDNYLLSIFIFALYLLSYIKEVIVDQKNIRKASQLNKVQKNDITDTQFIKSTLPIHAKMFEKHRVHNQLKLFRTLIEAELRYHCKAIEELSLVIRELALIEE